MNSERHHHVPNMISELRLVFVPVLVLLALRGQRLPFIVLLAISLSTDAIDGYLARKLHDITIRGSILDSWADFATYTTILAGGLLLWPHIIYSIRYYAAIVVGGYCVHALWGLMKFNHVPSYHTWSSKFSAIFMSVSVLVMYSFEETLMFRIAAAFQGLVYIENIAITTVLPEWRTDVRSLFHARQ